MNIDRLEAWVKLANSFAQKEIDKKLDLIYQKRNEIKGLKEEIDRSLDEWVKQMKTSLIDQKTSEILEYEKEINKQKKVIAVSDKLTEDLRYQISLNPELDIVIDDVMRYTILSQFKKQ